MSYYLIKIAKSNKNDKKLMAIFGDTSSNTTKTVHFGANGMSDFTIHRDLERKERYIKRHMKNENWNDPLSAGALSRWILWNKPDLLDSIYDYINRFNL